MTTVEVGVGEKGAAGVSLDIDAISVQGVANKG